MPKEKLAKEKLTLIKLYYRSLARYPWLTIGSIAANIGAFSLYTAIPWLYKNLFDALSGGGPRLDELKIALGIIVLLAIAHGIRLSLRFTSEMLVCTLEPNFMKDLVVSAFDYTIGQPYEFFANSFAGSLVRKIQRLGNAIEGIHDILHYNVTGIVITIVGSLLLVGLRSRILLLVFAVWIVLTIMVNFFYSRTLQAIRKERSAKDSENSAVLSDALTNSTNIRLFSGKFFETNLLKRVAEDLRRLRTKGWYRQNYLIYAQVFLLTAVEIFAVWYCAVSWSRGGTTVGDLILVQTIIARLNDMIWNLNNIFRNFYDNVSDAQEMIDILNTPYVVDDDSDAKKMQISHGGINFDHVGFDYGARREIFKDFSLQIAPGEKIALIGPSGAGKSTVIKLLFRLYDATRGAILIDGQNIGKVTQDSLHAALSMVPQDPILFHRSLADNIRYGRRDASEKEVIAAAKKAHCHEFISALPDGYKTFVGERGIKLSGGERQRVAIARAILKDAPILVLDEATSSLDSESEALIHDALRILMKGKTVIVIAHRLSTIMEMDRIIVMEDGRITDAGTHTELLARRGGTYKKLWEIQAGGFMKQEDEV